MLSRINFKQISDSLLDDKTNLVTLEKGNNEMRPAGMGTAVVHEVFL